MNVKVKHTNVYIWTSNKPGHKVTEHVFELQTCCCTTPRGGPWSLEAEFNMKSGFHINLQTYIVLQWGCSEMLILQVEEQTF